MNPIENVWHELKELVKRETKPDGIQLFWSTMAEYAVTSITSMHKVIPRVIENSGNVTGY